ncbi:MAG: restriction endonuclease [Chloroflexi bacterium]|nr:restriction endonuclease [Chloroflexota bacterium]
MTNTEGGSNPTVWLVAHGSDGEYESAALDLGIVLLGFQDVPDLTGLDEDKIGSLVSTLPSIESKSRPNVVGQMRDFAVRMKPGDFVASPLKNQPGQIALGRIVGDYQFLALDGAGRHTRSTEWSSETIPRSAYGPGAFHYLVTKRTISRIVNEEVAAKVRDSIQGHPVPIAVSEKEESSEEASPLSVEELARDQISRRIRERFPAEKLEHLVAALLEAQGFVVDESVPGKDQGVDVLAGHGPLGFDPPRICVQVKHTSSRVGQPDVQQLHGAMQQFDADQGLFVSWSDYTDDAKRMARLSFFSMRLWNANDLLEAIYQRYNELPEDIRAEIPLKQVWTLVAEPSES